MGLCDSHYSHIVAAVKLCCCPALTSWVSWIAKMHVSLVWQSVVWVYTTGPGLSGILLILLSPLGAVRTVEASISEQKLVDSVDSWLTVTRYQLQQHLPTMATLAPGTQLYCDTLASATY